MRNRIRKTENPKKRDIGEKKRSIDNLLCFVRFGCLESVLDSFLPVFLRQRFCCDVGQSFFRAPFDALRLFGLIVCAAVAGEYNFLFRMHVHSAELASTDAPAAAVAR